MDSLIGWLKLPQKVIWPIVIVTGILLWGSEPFSKGLGFNLFLEKYRTWVGVAFLFFLVSALLPVVPWCANKVRAKAERDRIRKLRLERISKLTPREKEVLKIYIKGNTKAQDLNIQDGVVGRLLAIDFLVLAAPVSYGGSRGSFTFPVNIQDWLWDELCENPDHIE